MSIDSWRAVDGDNTLALDWPLDENSHVWEIGGFEGRWVAQIWDKFHCCIDVFEPQLWAVTKMQERFAGNEKISIHPHGLWISDSTQLMGGFYTDGASILKEPEGDNWGEFKNITDELIKFIPEIDLCLMNIEGAEFHLLPYLLNSGDIVRFARFWCQFHTFADPSGQETARIYEKMEYTHRILWDHYPTAVAWERKL